MSSTAILIISSLLTIVCGGGSCLFFFLFVLGFMLLVQFFMFCVAICKKPTNMFRSVMMFWAYTTFIFTWILIYHMANTTTSIFVRQVMCNGPENFSEAMYLKRAEWMAGKRCYQFDKSFFPLEPRVAMCPSHSLFKHCLKVLPSSLPFSGFGFLEPILLPYLPESTGWGGNRLRT